MHANFGSHAPSCAGKKYAGNLKAFNRQQADLQAKSRHGGILGQQELCSLHTTL